MPLTLTLPPTLRNTTPTKLAHTLAFTKMHGLGNDFVMVNWPDMQALCTALKVPDTQWETLLPELTKNLCNRFTGIGADGLIVAAPNTTEGCLARFVYYNSDGTIAQMCGNGIRCFARFLHACGWTTDTTFNVDSLAGIKTLTLTGTNQVRVNMGPPTLIQQQIPAQLTSNPDQVVVLVPIQPEETRGTTTPITLVSMGNPHAILLNGPTKASHPHWGPALETHAAFPEKTNVEFATINHSTHITLDVWERGCGWTQACGTGACATVVAAKLAGVLPAEETQPVTVTLPGGDLSIEWSAPTEWAAIVGNSAGTSAYTDVSNGILSDVMMTGPAEVSFNGHVQLSVAS